MSDEKLRFATLAMRRVYRASQVVLSPLSAPTVVAYGSPAATLTELPLALSELATEERPTTVARYLLPAGARVETVEVEIRQAELPDRVARPFTVALAVGIVPEPRPDGAPDAGVWVFVPVVQHVCFVARTEDLSTRLSAELAPLLVALAPKTATWRNLARWTPVELESIDVEIATTAATAARSRKKLADTERRRVATETLAAAGRRFRPTAEDAAPIVARAAELAELERILEHRTRRSVLLVGEESSGKTALLRRYAAAHPQREIWATSASELVAGASGLGEWQERVARVLAAAEALDALLYFDDFGALFADRPGEGGVQLGAALRRHVLDGRISIIGEVTPPALDRAERREVSLIATFARVTINAFDVPRTIEACRAWAAHWAQHEPARPQLAPAILPAAVELARRYLPYRAFPGKAVRLLEELRVAHDRARDAKGNGPLLGEGDLYASFSSATGVPVALLADHSALAIDDIIAALRRRVIGQAAAVRRVAEAVAVAKARLQPADKPLASLLFVGPSGVGKTELARALAAYLFGAPDRMVRLDMSEYTDPWAAERLFGGGGDEGRLTAAVRSQPFGVVLLDEIEKAHPSVFDLLLQVLGEARLTDGRGRTTHFHNAIIVLTSNLGTRSSKGRLGIGPGGDDAEREERRYRDAVHAAFRPELVNRLDSIVVFHPLAPDEIARVAEIAVARLGERRGLVQTGALLDVSPRALAILAEGGFSPDLGARALRRYLDAHLVAPAARLLAKAGSAGHGGAITVRAPDEDAARPAGQRIGEHAGDVTVSLWRRATQTGARMVRSARALAGYRRDTDRELLLPPAQAVAARITELQSSIAVGARKDTRTGRSELGGAELARLAHAHARMSELLGACTAARDELHTAEELCLEALARDVDAVELIDAAIAQRQRFRRALFWLLTANLGSAAGATLLVHSPDHRAAAHEWLQFAVAAAAKRGWRTRLRTWAFDRWGDPISVEEFAKRGETAALLHVHGTGADLLFGLEHGLHRFQGLGGAPAHVWVQALEPIAEATEEDELRWPGPPVPKQPRGQPLRDAPMSGEITAFGEPQGIRWREAPERIEELSVLALLAALDKKPDEDDERDPVAALYEARWEHPLKEDDE
ncbi:MAG TPA: AAA family ATPase [Kofleriaceae bacterium]|jgi:ATP-dependent Clp protease ATP-binding subunit ClpC